MSRLQAALAIAVAGSVAACSPHKVVENPAPPVKLPPSFSKAPTGAPMPEKWWQDFNDPALNALIDQAFAGNFQLKSAWARFRQARAVAKAAGATRLPTFTVGAGGALSAQPTQFGSVTSTSLEVSGGVSYEIDIWKKISSQAKAASVNSWASRDDVDAMAISIASQITETWFSVLFERAQRKLLTEQVKTNKTFLEIVEFRFKQGLVTALDVFQQRQQLVATEAQLVTVVSRLAQAENALAVLVGKPPRSLNVGGGEALPKLPPLPNTGLPADLLVRRPDVRALRRRLVAADHNVAVAVANRLPGLTLQGQGGWRRQASSFGGMTQILTEPFYLLGANLNAILFDWGRNKAEVTRTKGVVEEALFGLGQALLVAMSEVENALIQEQQQIKLIANIKEQLELADKSFTQAQARYQAGLVDFLRVLTAQQNKQRLEVQLLGAERQLLSYRVQLCRALGGTWTKKLTAPKVVEPKNASSKRDKS